MPEYYYTALNAHNKEVWGTVQGASPEAAATQVEARGFRQVKITTPESRRKASGLRSRFQSVSSQELAVTSRQLAVMLAAGIGVQQALTMISKQDLKGALGPAWADILNEIQEGNYLSHGLNKHREIFGQLYVGMVRAGEASGTLVGNLQRVADHLEAEYALQARLRAALTYPAIVMIISVAIAVGIVQHILPTFLNGIFRDTGKVLPLPTQILMQVTAFFNDPRSLGTALVLLIAGAWLLYSHWRTPAGKRQFENLALATPGLSGILKKTLTCRVAQTMSTLLGSGLLAAPALGLTAEAVDSYTMADYLKTAEQDLRDGLSLEVCLRAIPIFPPVFHAFVALGEESGRIPLLMSKAAEIFEQDVELALLGFTQLVEPILVGVMGTMVGFVLIAIFIPLYDVLGSF